MISNGAVPAAGTAANTGQKKVAIPNKHPHTRVLTPVFAPALMPAADSGDISMGGPEKQPDSTVVSPV